MKKNGFILVFLFVSIVVVAQKDTDVLVTINNEKITVAEFKKAYEKNLNVIEDAKGKDVENNLTLFINYKLKVEEAYRLGLDSTKSYKREIESYQNQLTSPYLQDKEYLEKLVTDAYYRTKHEIRASHILVNLPRNYQPKDTVEAYNKIITARNRVLKGESFDKVAKEVSNDPSVAYNGGDLGYFSAFKMVFDFEEAAYTTKKGEVSMPFKTRFGYHIVTVTDERLSRGELEVAHILITDTTSVGKKRIDSVYVKAQSGESFADLANKYSNDISTNRTGGKLPKFGSGRMVKDFENAAFSITNEGEIGKPFRTRFGWHIIKLIKKHPVASFEKMEQGIRENVKQSGRSRLSDRAVLNRLKKTYKVKENQNSKLIFSRKDLRSIPKDSLQNVLLSINERNITQETFVNYIFNRRHLPVNILFEQFKDAELLKYFKDNLIHTEPEYAATLKEYQDGLILFELLQRKVWEPSQDTLALKSYFDTHKSDYQSKDLEKIKGKVMSDYQDHLEEIWVKDLRANNSVKIHKKTLKKLVNYYRKED